MRGLSVEIINITDISLGWKITENEGAIQKKNKKQRCYVQFFVL